MSSRSRCQPCGTKTPNFTAMFFLLSSCQLSVGLSIVNVKEIRNLRSHWWVRSWTCAGERCHRRGKAERTGYVLLSRSFERGPRRDTSLRKARQQPRAEGISRTHRVNYFDIE